MADLTDADKKSFLDKIIGALDSNKDALKAKDWDPTQRITNLKTAQTSITGDEGIVAQLEAALSTAVDNRRNDIDSAYDLASASVNSVEGALGKDHPLVRDLRQIRGSMSRETGGSAPGGTPPK